MYSDPKSNILHSPGTARPVTVVEIQALALQNEGTNAVLAGVSCQCSGERYFYSEWSILWQWTLLESLALALLRVCSLSCTS